MPWPCARSPRTKRPERRRTSSEFPRTRVPMQKIVVSGGAPLRGEVAISGAKNAVLPILCATLLADAPVEIANVPHLHDVMTTLKLLGELGASVDYKQGELARSLVVDPRTV